MSSLSLRILETVLTEANKHNRKCISTLTVKLGKPNHTKPNSLVPEVQICYYSLCSNHLIRVIQAVSLQFLVLLGWILGPSSSRSFELLFTQ